MTPEEMEKKMGQLVAKAWADEDFKRKLIANPKEIYKEFEIDVPEGIEVKVVENTDKVFHFVLPPKPSDELSDEALDGVSGGGFWDFFKIPKKRKEKDTFSDKPHNCHTTMGV